MCFFIRRLADATASIHLPFLRGTGSFRTDRAFRLATPERKNYTQAAIDLKITLTGIAKAHRNVNSDAILFSKEENMKRLFALLLCFAMLPCIVSCHKEEAEHLLLKSVIER